MLTLRPISLHPLLLAATILATGVSGFWLGHARAVRAQSTTGFSPEMDAVRAAPNSHKVVFENEYVRVLHVTLPSPGQTEPMHDHPWPSLFLGYDTGGSTPHIRYHTADGDVREQLSHAEPEHEGYWDGEWMAPEPLHAIEVIESDKPGPGAPPGWLRVEVKCAK